jgi:hypothetical protein
VAVRWRCGAAVRRRCACGSALLLTYASPPRAQMLDWANEFGGVFKFSLGFQWVVVISDPRVAVQVRRRRAASRHSRHTPHRLHQQTTSHLQQHARSVLYSIMSLPWGRAGAGPRAGLHPTQMRWLQVL